MIRRLRCFFGLFCALSAVLVWSAPLEVYDLRVDGMSEPLGIDSSRTHLSWKLAGDAEGAAQIAWEVRAASSVEKLKEGNADFWSTGRREGADQVLVRYRGEKPPAGKEVFWQVRVWNEADEVSDWSTVASWTSGLRNSAWEASWIAHPDWLRENRNFLGYRSESAESVDSPKWLEVDLGKVLPLEKIKLHAIRHTIAERTGFPTKFILSIARSSDFSDAVVIEDSTEEPKNIWLPSHTFEFEPTDARYIRLEVPELRELNGEICLALSQLEAYAEGTNVAVGARVTASDSLEDGLWAAAALVDGKGGPGTNAVANKTVVARREFPVKPALERAVLFVAGLGDYDARLNGAPVSDERIGQSWTETEETVHYSTFDVTELLDEGDNAIVLFLSNGMYNVADPGDRYTKLVGRFRPLMAIAELKLFYADGSEDLVVSDEAWKVREGPTTYSHVFGGEDLDPRQFEAEAMRPGFSADNWESAVVVTGPGGKLYGASYAPPPIRAFESFIAKPLHALSETAAVYDLGQNASIMPTVRMKGPAGSRIRITPAELLHEDGSLDRVSCGHNKPAWWEFTLAVDGVVEVGEASFFYHGARYLEVELIPAEEGGVLPELVSLEASVVHSEVAPVGAFACSSELFNRTYEMIRWAQRSNTVSVFTDCPHRERLGWLEQTHLHGPSLRYQFDLQQMYTKIFGDMADAQTAEGLIPNIAPEYITFEGDFRDSPEWGAALILGAWQQYVFYGDDRAFLDHYNAMQGYFEYLSSQADGHILDHGLGDWYDLGPERPGFAQLTPVALTATAIYYEMARTMSWISEYRTRYGEAAAYAERAEHIREAFNAKFFDAETGSYATGSQTANAMPLALGMVPDGREAEVLDALVKQVLEVDQRLTAGDVGHRYLLRALADHGRSDVIWALHHQTDHPGYGWMLERGATSLTEAWDANRRSSQNHFMLGHLMEWFFHDLVGIAPDSEQAGFGHVIIAPQPVGVLTWAEATYDSVRGPIYVRWELKDGSFDLQVDLPPNVTASVRLPGEGVEAARSISSGAHHFSTPFLR
jgi:hypothetical protein